MDTLDVSQCGIVVCFIVNGTATTEIYTYGHTLSLHDALPSTSGRGDARLEDPADEIVRHRIRLQPAHRAGRVEDGEEVGIRQVDVRGHCIPPFRLVLLTCSPQRRDRANPSPPGCDAPGGRSSDYRR